MTADNWRKAVEFFQTPQHMARSQANKKNRQQQRYTNHGGTASYSSACYKEVMLAFNIVNIFKESCINLDIFVFCNVKQDRDLIEQFRKAHCDADGNFFSPVAQEDYVRVDTKYTIYIYIYIYAY